MLDAVLFDLDGTLTDPVVGITTSFRHALEVVGHAAPPDEDLRWVIGPPLRENFARYGLPEHLHDDAAVAYRERHVEVGVYEATLVEGMAEVLDALGAGGVRLALATLKPVDQAHVTLRHFGLEDRFEAVAGVLAYGFAAHKSAIVKDVLARLPGVEPQRTAMVGDRRHDVEGGRGNGCRTVAVTWGYAEPGELEQAAPDRVVTTPGELRRVLRELR